MGNGCRCESLRHQTDEGAGGRVRVDLAALPAIDQRAHLGKVSGRSESSVEPFAGEAVEFGEVAFLTAPEGKAGHGVPELRNAEAGPGADAKDGRRRSGGEGEHGEHLGLDAIRAGEVGLVNNEDIGDLEQAGLLPLQFVAGFGLEEENEDIDESTDGGIALPRADGFDEDNLEAEGLDEPDEGVEMGSQGPLPSGGGETADEDAVVIGSRGHAEAIAEEGTTGERTLRIAGENGDAQLVAADLLEELAGETALADAAGSREGDDPGEVLTTAERGEDGLDLLTARDHADEAGESEAVAAVEAFKKWRQHGDLRWIVGER